ncbi:protein SENSITIVE TO UV 2 isoform X1 [Ziziphus jujuba]|uniref:Protein SENSITIVE TO UV 2 isoform X1 n=1 Tax=Ziziphus jujuba TaxID=326968 RepID=A0A6P6FP47_ZIZJJ|nr:protein SENSITIVE TO UV 2 isoform X1 [Ziziphus jujuba]XP_060674073.1 protein SENSITIVE TO UV 2 isoform X1 [Ziziphus jujuba]XP_060674074.1 protein SENSITIVE TO UV 2 isoform X1 [Ziziphus jujuba]XP_060674075.1 protein SENSITIVE TO UV 2 isoform X1 [Ziziphus jujuba]XP_060674076.1 protein SENSITIVE TO UV 2 isoform X1 [Ziziphus jujuba]XP_060674077.1 protein SENSITIVE TO UV 2 isoform X1 [Ziziphus jujuba]XP_060674078.1 protein SENSITIVE TO UV 2 isoform X1 [Ziziphus jujuba]XP_060674079.1 protein SE
MAKEDEFEEWDKDFWDQVIEVEELVKSSSSISSAFPNPSSQQQQQPFLLHPPPFSSSTTSTFSSSQYLSHPPLPTHRQEAPTLIAAAPSSSSHCYHHPLSYSPPRELSQRIAPSFGDPVPRSSNGIANCAPSSLPSAPSTCPSEIDKELEIERLKRELGRVSKHLSELEHECSKLRKERDKKEEPHDNVHLKNAKKDVLCHSKSTNLESGALTLDRTGVSRQFQDDVSLSSKDGCQVDIATSTCKGPGIQTNEADVCAQVIINNDLPSCHDLSKKLLAIWGRPNDEKIGRNLISNLLVSCEPDFHDLFGFIGMDFPSKLRTDSQADRTSGNASRRALEAAKVSHLYSVLMKINNGMVELQALLEPLLDLCYLENVVIVHRCLRILHVFLKYLLSFKEKSGGRENVMVERLCSGINSPNPHKSESAEKGDLLVGRDGASCGGYDPPLTTFLDAESLYKKGQGNPYIATSVSHVDWVCLFEKVLQIAMTNMEEFVRLEAVSIMNVILMESNAYMERDKFGHTLVFECVSQLLTKEAGLHVQKHAMQFLYLLLNCPDLLVTFCSGCTEGEHATFLEDNKKNTSASQKFSIILQGLADCLACHGNGLEGLKLRRNAIVLLAFLASSGKSGFEILVHHRLFKDANFLMLILQLLVSEMDMEEGPKEKEMDMEEDSKEKEMDMEEGPKNEEVDMEEGPENKEDIKSAELSNSPEVSKERTLLIREALILLNRLVSSPAYSATALQLLTGSRDMATLTIDIANRLSRKDRRSWNSFNGMERMMIRDSEVVNLARIFKKRVFTYLGDHIS